MSRARVDYSGLNPTTGVPPVPDISGVVGRLGDSLGQMGETAARSDYYMRRMAEQERRVRLAEIDSSSTVAMTEAFANAAVEAESDMSGRPLVDVFKGLASEKYSELASGIDDPEERRVWESNRDRMFASYLPRVIEATAKRSKMRVLDADQSLAFSLADSARTGMVPFEAVFAKRRESLQNLVDLGMLQSSEAEQMGRDFESSAVVSAVNQKLVSDPAAALDLLGMYGSKIEQDTYRVLSTLAERELAEKPIRLSQKVAAQEAALREEIRNAPNFAAKVAAVEQHTEIVRGFGMSADDAMMEHLAPTVMASLQSGEISVDDAEALYERIVGSSPDAPRTQLAIASAIQEVTQYRNEMTKTQFIGESVNSVISAMRADGNLGGAMAVMDGAIRDGEEKHFIPRDEMAKRLLKPVLDSAVANNDDEAIRSIRTAVSAHGLEAGTLEMFESALNRIEKYRQSAEAINTREAAVLATAEIAAGLSPVMTPDVRAMEYQIFLREGGGSLMSLEQRVGRYQNAERLPEPLVGEIQGIAPGGRNFFNDPYRFMQIEASAGTKARALMSAVQTDDNVAVLGVYQTLAPVMFHAQGTADERRFLSLFSGDIEGVNKRLASHKMLLESGSEAYGSRIGGDDVEIAAMPSSLAITEPLGMFADPGDLESVPVNAIRDFQNIRAFFAETIQDDMPGDEWDSIYHAANERAVKMFYSRYGTRDVGEGFGSQYEVYDRTLFSGMSDKEFLDDAGIQQVRIVFGASADGINASAAFRDGGNVVVPVYRNKGDRIAPGVPVGYYSFDPGTQKYTIIDRDNVDFDAIDSIYHSDATAKALSSSLSYAVNPDPSRFATVYEMEGSPELEKVRDRTLNSIYQHAAIGLLMSDSSVANDRVSQADFDRLMTMAAQRLSIRLGFKHGIGAPKEPAGN